MTTDDEAGGAPPLRKPPWLRVRVPGGRNHARLSGLVHGRGLHTVCEEALCPNLGRCWENGRATLMILGDVCTRGCTFCGVQSGRPSGEGDEQEPRRVAEAVQAMGLEEVVITSVTRDDLPDGGGAIWAETIRCMREAVPGLMIEVLIPDFAGSPDSLTRVFDAGPDILGHNLETVPALYERVRPRADLERSLGVLRRAHERGLITKTGIMVGLGEPPAAVFELMARAVAAGGDIFTVGQYLRPSAEHVPVTRYVEPSEFEQYRLRGLELGFAVVVSGPLVRSSYHSDEQTDYVRRRAVTHDA